MFSSVLDQEKQIIKLDSLRIYPSILSFPNQVRTTWQNIHQHDFNTRCGLVQNVIISGMGGSALGGRVIQSFTQVSTRVPIEIVTNFRLPSYVNEKSLVVISSYSGNTQETISTLLDAQKKKAQIFVITSGGKILSYAKSHQIDYYQILTTDNPSNQPRMGIGSSIMAQVALLNHCNFFDSKIPDISGLYLHLEQSVRNLEIKIPLSLNPAKIIANNLKNYAIVLIAANHLVGASHAIKNMFNENSKTFCSLFDLPELCHHFLEGLSFPNDFSKHAHFILISSANYPTEIKKRMEVVKQIIKKQGYLVSEIKPESSDPMTESFETILFGEFLSFYLSVLNGIDPGPIPWVNYLKDKISSTSNRI